MKKLGFAAMALVIALPALSHAQVGKVLAVLDSPVAERWAWPPTASTSGSRI